MIEPHKAGRYRISMEQLHKMLGLSEKLKIVAVDGSSFSNTLSKTVDLLIEGEGMPPLAKGEDPPFVPLMWLLEEKK